MEDSRKGTRSRKRGLPTLDPHVDEGNDKKAIVYNTKREKKKGEEGEKKKRDNRKRKEFSTLSQNIRACSRTFSV